MGGEVLRQAQNVVLMLILATALCTLAGAWFAACSRMGMVWLFLVMAASCGISALVALLLLPEVVGFHGIVPLDAVLALVVAVGAVRTWSVTLDQMDFTS